LAAKDSIMAKSMAFGADNNGKIWHLPYEDVRTGPEILAVGFGASKGRFALVLFVRGD
jgi:hypothetical protein